MTTYRFTGPTIRRQRRGICPRCSKTVTRSLTFEHTVNPFNRHPVEDRPKTWDEVRADVVAKADAWKPDFTCQTCKDAQQLDKATITQLISWVMHEGNERYNQYREGSSSRAALCNQRIAQYEARISVLDPGRIDWPTSCLYDRNTRTLRYCCYYEFTDGQRCVYSERHGYGYHLSPAGQKVSIGSNTGAAS